MTVSLNQVGLFKSLIGMNCLLLQNSNDVPSKLLPTSPRHLSSPSRQMRFHFTNITIARARRQANDVSKFQREKKEKTIMDTDLSFFLDLVSFMKKKQHIPHQKIFTHI